MKRLLASLTALAIIAFARVVTGVRGNWIGCTPSPAQRIYFANHVSHGDFVLIWTVLPSSLRQRTRPVAGAEYWRTGALRRFVGSHVFNAVLIERDRAARTADPIETMVNAIDAGCSLILFPEGTRNMTDDPLLAFKAGLFHLAKQRPDVDLVPVWVENLNRVMPKGHFVPVPLICTVSLGVPMRLNDGEGMEPFLARARDALLALSEKERAR
jgi:1-acyl-sn-glycerol-3-phosphate acyltransferase